MEIQKFKCPKCNSIIDNTYTSCPTCKSKFNWGASTVTQTNNANAGSNRKDVSSDFLLNKVYWLALVTYLMPAIGWIFLYKFKAYSGNLNRRKAATYVMFKRKTVMSTVFWLVLVALIAIMAIVNYNRAKSGAV